MTGSEPTHEWEFKIKDANNGDMRHYIEKIVINLHETFAEPVQGILLFLLFFTCTLIKTFILLYSDKIAVHGKIQTKYLKTWFEII